LISSTKAASVVVFPDDPARWTYPTRYVRTVRADDQGRHRQPRPPLQPRLPQNGTDKAVCQVVHEIM